jgi:hypothetical protein
MTMSCCSRRSARDACCGQGNSHSTPGSGNLIARPIGYVVRTHARVVGQFDFGSRFREIQSTPIAAANSAIAIPENRATHVACHSDSGDGGPLAPQRCQIARLAEYHAPSSNTPADTHRICRRFNRAILRPLWIQEHCLISVSGGRCQQVRHGAVQRNRQHRHRLKRRV